MKFLLLSVVALFLAGIEGRSFWQQDAPSPPTMLEQSFAILKEVLNQVDYAEIAKNYHLKEKLDNAKGNAEKYHAVLQSYSDALKKKSDEVLETHFPTFKTEVLPHFQTLEDKFEEELKSLAQKFLPAGSEFVSELNHDFDTFFEKLYKVAEHGRDQVRADFDALRSAIQPFADDVKAEYEKYKEATTDSLGKKIMSLKNDLVHELEALTDKVKPLTDAARAHVGTQITDAHTKIEKLLKDLYDAVKSKLDEETKQESA